MQELIKRHFQSAGFQKRFKFIYLPLLKKAFAYFWNLYADKKEKTIFADAYRHNAPLVIPEEAMANAMGKMQLPLYETVGEKLKAWFVPSEEQGSTGQCVAFSMENIIKNIAKVIGFGDISISPLDTYVDRTTRRFAGDYTGMNPSLMMRDVARKGIAVGNLLTRVTDQSVLKNYDDRAFYPDALLDPFRVKILKSHTDVGRNFDTLVSTINSVPTGFPIQISLTVTKSYFGYDIPDLSSTEEYGGHSIVAIGGSACIVDGKEGFFITDSAYYKNRVARWGVSIRFISREYWERYGGWSLKPKFTDEIEAKLSGVVPPIKVKIELGAKFNDVGEHVKAIQLALIAKGEIIPAGATGVYGQQTADAVLSFQLKNLQKFYEADSRYNEKTLRDLGGKNFGALSIKVINL